MATEVETTTTTTAAPAEGVKPIELTKEDNEIRNRAWNGFVPICFTLHPDDNVLASNSNTLFVLANRMVTLPVLAIDDKYNKSLFRNISGAIPELWFEDQKTKIPLKWYLPIGVLYDLYKSVTQKGSSDDVSEEDTPIWDVVVHYSEYPDVLTHWVDKENYKASFIFTVKESVYTKFGDLKITNGLTKEETDSICNMAINNNSYNAEFRTLLDKYFSTNTPSSIPARICMKDKPFVQQSIGPNESLREVFVKAFGEEMVAQNNFEGGDVLIHGIVVPLDVKMAWIYAVFAYPDGFLYISVNK